MPKECFVMPHSEGVLGAAMQVQRKLFRKPIASLSCLANSQVAR